MGNLAETYTALGRHADALAMREQVLELFRRVLPANCGGSEQASSQVFGEGEHKGPHTHTVTRE